MTNSTPKMSDKIERQGSPNAGGKRHQRNNNNNNNNSIKSSSSSSSTSTSTSTTYFQSGNRHSRNSNGRSSCSPPCPGKNISRVSPVRQSQYDSPRGSPTNGNFYAGAKFSEPPSPASLPKPPSHWTTRLISTCSKQSDHCRDISNHLKMILNVQA